MSQAKPARKAGISLSLLSEIENGDRALDHGVAAALAQAMGIILDELLGQTPVQGKGKGKGKGKEALNEPGSPCNTPLTIRWETQIMSASHSRMADHWWWRPGWRQGRRLYTWPPDASRRSAGRVAKTLRLLAVVDPVDDTYRRQMNRQLTVQESRHRLARDVCHGKCGTIHQVYRGRGRTSSARSAWS